MTLTRFERGLVPFSPVVCLLSRYPLQYPWPFSKQHVAMRTVLSRGLHSSAPVRMKVLVPVKRVVDYAVKVRGPKKERLFFSP